MCFDIVFKIWWVMETLSLNKIKEEKCEKSHKKKTLTNYQKIFFQNNLFLIFSLYLQIVNSIFDLPYAVSFTSSCLFHRVMQYAWIMYLKKTCKIHAIIKILNLLYHYVIYSLVALLSDIYPLQSFPKSLEWYDNKMVSSSININSYIILEGTKIYPKF